MIPGNSRILVCPSCGGEKEVMSLLSANNFGAELWSDNKQIAPMAPEVSYVQKCPHCGKYYVTERQEVKYAEESWSFETGSLSYPEMKEAFFQLLREGFVDTWEEAAVRMMLHQAYNDYYYRSGDNREINAEDKSLFCENGFWLTENALVDGVLKAEFYREMGEMNAAKCMLDSVKVEDRFLKRVVSGIRDRVKANDCAVFKIQ